MYVCARCGELTGPGVAAHRVVTETRVKIYPRRVIGRGKAGALPEGDSERSGSWRAGRAIDPGGTGRETVQEIVCCPACCAMEAAKTEKSAGLTHHALRAYLPGF